MGLGLGIDKTSSKNYKGGITRQNTEKELNLLFHFPIINFEIITMNYETF
jgi:hypothetical protein